MAGLALIILDGQLDLGAGWISRSLVLNPNSADAWVSSGMYHNHRGDYETAIEHFDRAQRLNPLDTLHHFRWNLVGMSYFGAGRYDEAYDAANQCLNVGPTYPQALFLKLATCGQLGRAEEAAGTLTKLLAVHPGCTLTWASEYFGPMFRLRNPDFVERYIDGARRAGLPE